MHGHKKITIRTEGSARVKTEEESSFKYKYKNK